MTHTGVFLKENRFMVLLGGGKELEKLNLTFIQIPPPLEQNLNFVTASKHIYAK